MLRSVTYDSQILGNQREVRLQSFGRQDTDVVLIVFDGEYYVDRMDAPAIIESLVESRAIQTPLVAYVSHLDGATRWRESFCNADLACAIDQELIPLIRSAAGVEFGRWFLGGLSATGLAAVYAALTSATEFEGVFAQSGSFWWNENWLAKQVPSIPRRRCRVRLSCGSDEIASPVDHGNGLVQMTPQRTAVEAICAELRDSGYEVDYECFDGGHQTECWARELPNVLNWLIPRQPAS